MPLDSVAAIEEGHAALARGEWQLARTRFTEALEVEESPLAYEGLGIAARYAVDAEAALDAHERGYRLARAHGDAVMAARLAVQLGYSAYAFRGPAEARGWVERAAMLVDGRPPTIASATIPVMRAHLALLADHDPATARDLTAQAIRLATEIGAVDVEMHALALNGLALVSLGEVDAGMRSLDAATAAALGGELTDADSIETICCFLIDACRRVRDLDRAQEWCERVRDIASRYDDRQMFSVCRTYYADVLMWHGDWQRAEHELTTAVRELASIRPGREIDAVVRLAELRRRQGHLDEARRLLAQAEGHRFHALVEGQLALNRGDAAGALEAGHRFLRLIGNTDRFERVPGLELVVRAAVACKDESARAAVHELADIAEATPTLPLRASARLAEGRVAAGEGDVAAARLFLEEAGDLFARAGAPYDAAEAWLELASVLQVVGRADAAERARERAQSALDRLGARSVGARPGGLTAREVEVLRLVAAGLSNDEIAAQLVLSVRTVERHVANTYAKIDARGRTARAIATAWAHAHGIA